MSDIRDVNGQFPVIVFQRPQRDSVVKVPGVNRIDEPRMGLQDDESVYQQLLSEASRNARDRAQAIASTLGEELGQVLHVSTHEVAVPRPMVMERAMMAADASTSAASESYQTGHISYRVTVSASFALR